MPVDVGHGRHGRHGDLGTPLVWNCPACGQQQTGRRPEQGCGGCGAGTPQPAREASSEPAVGNVGQQSTPSGAVVTAVTRPGGTPDSRPLVEPKPLLRVLRLIEYLVKPGKEDALRLTLQRSLVGHVNMGWGTITGTIVDTIDGVQEDRLRMAHLQPGVWLSKPEVNLSVPPGELNRTVDELIRTLATNEKLARLDHGRVGRDAVVDEAAASYLALQQRKDSQMQAVGNEPSDNAMEVAQEILQATSLRVIHTLALALQTIAPELDANSETEKFLSTAECLELAQALMNLVPDDWQGDQPQPTEETSDGPTA